MTTAAARPFANPVRVLSPGALALGLAVAAVVGTALAFEHVGGYIPCALCLEQREPYYVAAPLLLAAAALAAFGRAGAARVLIALAGLAMLYAAYLGAFHAGVEWGWWPGPTDCAAAAGPVDTSGGLLSQLDRRPPSCDRAAGRFVGLSFAGWQVVAAVPLALASLMLAVRGRA